MAKVTLVYDDGRSDVLSTRAAGLVAAERKWKGNPPAIEGALYACWFGLRPSLGDVDFDTWLGTIADMEIDAGEKAPDPSSAPPPEV